MNIFLTTLKSLEPDEELIEHWAKPSGKMCLMCGKEITNGELDAQAVCSECYFKEVGDAK
jgi:hypothetical protein